MTGINDRRRIARAMTEAELQEHVRVLCRDLGLFHYHPYDSTRSEKGWPDSVIIGKSGVLFRELKSMAGKLTPEQTRVGYMLKAVGQSWKTWRPIELLDGTIRRELADIAGTEPMF
jgi:hypothetical protein